MYRKLENLASINDHVFVLCRSANKGRCGIARWNKGSLEISSNGKSSCGILSSFGEVLLVGATRLDLLLLTKVTRRGRRLKEGRASRFPSCH